MTTSEGEPGVFEVRLRSKKVQRELDGLPRTDYERVLARIRALAENPAPQGCQKLYDHIYRIRAGDLRIIYLIDEDNKRIEVGGIRRRSEKTYRGLDELFQ